MKHTTRTDTTQQPRPSDIHRRLDAPEFFNAPVLVAIVLFAANNLWLKFAYPGWLTGKLSDFLFCFFFPLYCSALIGLVSHRPAHTRLYLGALLTLASFVAMKTIPSVSAQVSAIFSYFTEPLGFGHSRNVVDHTDLVAAPAIIASVIFGQKRRTQRQ